MEKHATKIPVIIPRDDWVTHGTWQDTLKEELLTLPADTLTMCIKSTSKVFFAKYPFVYGLSMHGICGQWCPLSGLPGYEYCWETTDGRGLDELNIHGPFNKSMILEVISKFEEVGLRLLDRWSLVITFGK